MIRQRPKADVVPGMAGGPQAGLAELRDASFGYSGSSEILRGMSLSIEPGEFVALLGPSGCGKTTILNLIAGFIQPLGGAVFFDGAPLRRINTGIGYMTQSDTLLPWRTVMSNVALPLENRRVRRDEQRERVAAVLDLVGLSNAKDRYPAQLSGGMKRRALLARSLVYRPKMLLMDEPFGALDAQMREALHAEFLKMVAELRQTVLFVTHDLQESVLLADRILVVSGSPLRVRDEVSVPFGKDRDPRTLPLNEEFLAVQARVRAALHDDPMDSLHLMSAEA